MTQILAIIVIIKAACLYGTMMVHKSLTFYRNLHKVK